MKACVFRSLCAAAVLAFAVNANASVIGFEDFDGGAINLSTTSNVFDFGSGGGSGGDAFGRIEPFVTGAPFDVADDSAADVSGDGTGGAFPGDSLGIIGQNSSSIFALADSDGPGVPQVSDGAGGMIDLNDATWSFDISSAPAIASISIDIGAMGDFEASSTDGIRIDAQVDGGGFQTIFLGRVNEAIDFEYSAFDDGDVFTLNDPLELFIDGSATAAAILDRADATTGEFETFTSTLFAGATGTTLDIRVSFDGTPSGSEPIGIDNITVTAVPEPGAALLVLLGVAFAGAARMRSQLG